MNYIKRILKYSTFGFLLLILLSFNSCKTTTKTVTAPYEYTSPPGRFISQWDVDDAKDTEVSVLWSLVMYHQDLGEYPDSLEKLVQAGYLTIDPGIQYKWKFYLEHVDTIPLGITATYQPWLEYHDTAIVSMVIMFEQVPGQWRIVLKSFDDENVRILPIPPYPTAGYYSWQGQGALREIVLTCQEYSQDLGEDPINFAALVSGGYINYAHSDSTLLRQWNFTWVGNTPIDTMWATSTSAMPLGAGHVVTYILATHEFKGYGIP